MKTLYLHAGAHKTGSSSIQVNLAKFAAELEAAGLTYLLGWNEAYDYPHHVYRSTGNANPLAYAMRWHSDKESYKSFVPEAVFEHLFAMIAQKESVIVSHEDLIGADKAFLEVFRGAANAAGWQVKPVIYVRDQISWHVSNYNQHIRQNRYAGTFESLLARSLSAANWHAHATRFADAFGKENMIVRLYHKSLMQNRISALFIDGLGLDSQPLQGLEEASVNVSISTGDALVLAHFHRHSDDPKLSKKLIGLLQKLPRGGDCELVTNEIAAFLRAYYAESNDKLVEQYFTQAEKDLFEQTMNAPRERGETLSLALDRSVVAIRLLLES